jgi:hypothetical protein
MCLSCGGAQRIAVERGYRVDSEPLCTNFRADSGLAKILLQLSLVAATLVTFDKL